MATDDPALDDALRAKTPGGKDSTTTPSVPAVRQASYKEEIASLRGTVNELLGTIDAHEQEKDRSDAFAVLVQQLQDANEHLVLATLDARALQATAEAATP